MSDPAKLLYELAQHDSRIYCAFDISKNKYVYSNAAFQAFFHLNPEEATPKLLFDMVHAEDRNYLQTVFASMKPGDFRENLEFRFILRDKVHHLRLSMVLTECETDGRTITGYIDDITGFRESLDTMEALSSKKNAVLNILSHDLAGPLGSISNYSYLLSKKADANDQLTMKMIHSIESIAKRCIRLIQEFVKMEFIESVGTDLVKTRYNLVERVSVFMEDYLQHELELKKNIRFICDEPPIYAEIDEYKFMQVINNLISNALKFTPDNGTIEVKLSQRDKFVHIEVKDTGIGIPEEFHDTLFDKFSAARRPGIKGETSVGLGMSIIKTIVEWHMGRIWFDSKVGVGTTFYVEIPGCD
jgi:two-component system sensor histidine kinase VicK